MMALFRGSLRRFRSLTKSPEGNRQQWLFSNWFQSENSSCPEVWQNGAFRRGYPGDPNAGIIQMSSWLELHETQFALRIIVTSDSLFKWQIFGGKFNERQTLSLSKTSEPMSLSMLNNQQNTNPTIGSHWLFSHKPWNLLNLGFAS